MQRNWTTRTTLLLAGLILVVLNLIGLNVFFRIDLTDDRVYSLSEASIETVRSLDDPVTVRVFFTADLPAPYSSYRRFLRDKLDEYRAYGGHKFQYKFLDPGSDESLQQEVARYNIPPVQVQVIENDNLQIKNAYMGLVVEYAGKRETIPVIEDLSTLEYDLTSAIRKLTRDQLPVAGFLTEHGELGRAAMETFGRALERIYQVRTVSVKDSMLDPRPDVLFIIAPTDTFPVAHLQAIDRYLMEGGRVAVLLNRVNANLQFGFASEQHTGLEDLLAHYGAVVRPDLVMDRQSSVVTLQRTVGFFRVAQMVAYPFFPIATRFNGEHPMVSRLREVFFYYVSSIDTSAALPKGVTRIPLVYSTPQSTTQQGFFTIQPALLPDAEDFRGGPYVLAVALHGTFPSAYDSTRVGQPARLVVVGDGDIVNEQRYGGQLPPGNLAFALNMADWLSQDEALLMIRAKSVAPRALEPVSESLRPLIKYANILGPVVLVVLFGLIRWRIRRQRQIVLTH